MARPPRILSLDGGGIRGLSTLKILEEIMERIRREEGLQATPLPRDYFDLIGGTSTGGIIAIMLGRLGMSVNDTIQAYRNVGQKAFTPKRSFSLPAPPKGLYSATALEEAIKRIIKEQCQEQGCADAPERSRTCKHEGKLFREPSTCKTAVLAITKDNIDARPILFKTYNDSDAFANCAIWQVARATSAATTFFKSIKCGRDGIEFIDAGFGYNNPCEVLIEEARNLFPEAPEMLVLSIGTGLGDVVEIKDSRASILNALKTMASESNKVANRLKDTHAGKANYFRFNVDRGLQDVTLADWEKSSKILGHTLNYVNDQKIELAHCAKAFSVVRLPELPIGAGDRQRNQAYVANNDGRWELDTQVPSQVA